MVMKYILVAILTIYATLGAAQTTNSRTISLAVLNEDNHPLASSSVRLMGKQGSIIAKGDGNFTIHLNSNADTLLVSHLGYHEKRVGIKNTSPLSIVVTLKKAGATQLEEVVVNTGYQSLPKESHGIF